PAPGGYYGYPGHYGGGFGPPGYGPGFTYPQPPPRRQVVRHTLTRRNWLTVVIATAVLAAAIGGIVGAVVGVNHQQTFVEKFFPNKSVLSQPQDIQSVLSKVEPAVVSIDSHAVQSSGGDFVEAAGTGMILTPQGEVLTNNHVVSGASSVTATLFGQTKSLPAHVIGTDPSRDLALVQIDNASNLPTVTLGNSGQTQVGDDVLAIGNALALSGGPSVTEGIVSAENRSLSTQDDSGKTENLSGLLQTDAAINPGNSGGPLVNAQAQVIGINTAVAASSQGNAPTQNIGFAIAIDSVKPQLASLRQGGTGGPGATSPSPAPAANKAYIGVSVQSVSPALQQQDHLTPAAGALVNSVQAGSPADQAGLKANDVIVSLNGSPISTASGLTTALHPLNPGDVVKVGFYRGSAQQTVSVTLGTNPAAG
ncbi:MAG TPA: trypsin-like peptidase domain-containing protein, partial [Acidimicrobiales bacterium]